MPKFKYYIIFKSSGTLEGTWTGVIEEFTELFINPNINQIYSYQIWLDVQDAEPAFDLLSQKRDMDMFDEMIEQHERDIDMFEEMIEQHERDQEELEQHVAQQWAREQYLRETNPAYWNNPEH